MRIMEIDLNVAEGHAPDHVVSSVRRVIKCASLDVTNKGIIRLTVETSNVAETRGLVERIDGVATAIWVS